MSNTHQLDCSGSAVGASYVNRAMGPTEQVFYFKEKIQIYSARETSIR